MLDAVGKNIFYCGALGQGTRITIITNLMLFANCIAMGEGLMLAKKAGIDLALINLSQEDRLRALKRLAGFLIQPS